MENPAIVKAYNLAHAKRRVVCMGLALVIGCLLWHDMDLAWGYNVPTHEEIGKKVADVILDLVDDPNDPGDDQAYRQNWLEFKKRHGIVLNRAYTDPNPDNCDDRMLGVPTPNRARIPAGWIECGNGAEDSAGLFGVEYGTGRARPYNHFYNPVWNDTDYQASNPAVLAQRGGLYDPDGSPYPGIAAVEWASDHANNSPARCQRGDPISPTESRYSWNAARCYLYKAIAEQVEADRNIYIARTFRSLGHIIHLLQDMGQPAHVRNDAHPTDSIYSKAGYHDRIEAWAEQNIHHRTLRTWARRVKQLMFNNPAMPFYKRLVDSQQPTIKDFFDAAPMGRNFGGRGLSEFANHNFYSEDTVSLSTAYGHSQYFDQHRFRYPQIDRASCGMPMARFRGLLFEQDSCFLREFVDPLPLDPNQPAGRQQVAVNRFWQWVGIYGAGDFTILDGTGYIFAGNVNQLIPKTMAYSAGAIEFFFRGKLDVRAVFALQPGTNDGGRYNLEIRNRSGEPLGPGKLTIYKEDSQGRRDPMPCCTDRLVGQVQDGQLLFSPFLAFDIPDDPNFDAKNGFIIVYRGQLGNELANEAAGMVGAVAAQRFHLLRVNNTWEPDATQDLYMRAPDGTTIISWYRQDTPFGRRDPDYNGTCVRGPDNITVKELAVPGNYTFLINYFQDWWQERQVNSTPPPPCTPENCPNEPPATCPPGGDTLPPGRHGEDNPPTATGPSSCTGSGSPSLCYCRTKVHNTVRTYFNSYRPVRLQRDVQGQRDTHIDLCVPTYNRSDQNVRPNRTEGQVDSTWWVAQTACVADDGTISTTGVNNAPERLYNPTTGKCCTTGGNCVP